MPYYIGKDDDDLIKGTQGTDIVFSLSGDDVISTYGPPRGTDKYAEYRAQAADRTDFVFAGDGDDRIDAGGGHDTVWGGDGDDVMLGGAGVDMLGGGAGDDIFVFGWLGGPSAESDTRTGRNGRDAIRDFEPGNDLIDLSGYENADAPGAVWLGTREPTATKQLQVGYHIEGNLTVVEIYATTGTGRAKVSKPVGEIELLGSHTLTAGDFIL